MKLYAFAVFIAVLVSSALAREGAHEQPRLKQRNVIYPCIYLCDCWSNPGAESRVVFLLNCPKTFPINSPDYEAFLTYSHNYDFENGGWVMTEDNANLSWAITNPKAGFNLLAGNATLVDSSDDNNHSYRVLKGADEVLWSPVDGYGSFNCSAAYKVELIDSDTPTNASNLSTTSPDSTSIAAPTATPIATPTQIQPSTPQQSPSTYTGLPPEAKVYISISAITAVLVFLLVVVLLRRLQQKRILKHLQLSAHSSISRMEK